MNSTGKILMAALAGAAVGVVAGLILAPAKGSETRAKIADAAKKASDNVQDLAGSATSRFGEMKNKFRDRKREMESSFEKKKEFIENNMS